MIEVAVAAGIARCTIWPYARPLLGACNVHVHDRLGRNPAVKLATSRFRGAPTPDIRGQPISRSWALLWGNASPIRPASFSAVLSSEALNACARPKRPLFSSLA